MMSGSVACCSDKMNRDRCNPCKRHLLMDHERIECWKRVFEEGDLNVIDEHGEFAGIVDQRSKRGCVREGALHARQERTFNIVVGEEIEIDGYAVPDLES